MTRRDWLGWWAAAACACLAAAGPAAVDADLRLATTTSTADSGLLAAILPGFERSCGCRVRVIAVGTGQALAIGRRGDADVLLVHARAAEDRFVAEGHARGRREVMYNDFVIVGPKTDPARIAGRRFAGEALRLVARGAAAFVSRGDRSGTHDAENRIWAALAISPVGSPWYRSLGQGMGETLMMANELRAYTLTDRGTWLSMRRRLPELELLVGGRTLAENTDPTLRNPYGVLVVDGERHPGVNAVLAERFARWLVSGPTQAAIGRFGLEQYGQPLFYPVAAAGTTR